MGLKVEVLKLVGSLIISTLLGLFFSNGLPDVVLQGLDESSTIYSAKLGGVGLVYLLLGLTVGVSLSVRALIVLAWFPTKVMPHETVLSLAVIQLMIFIGFALSYWYIWSYLVPVAR